MGGSAFFLSVLTCAALLALAILCAQRMAKSALALPLLLLCLDLLVWNGASLAYDATSVVAWRWLDVSTSPLTAPLAFDFVLAFVGKRRRLRAARLACWSAFGALSLASALAFVLPAARAFAGSNLWAMLFLAGLLASMTFAVVLLARHMLKSADPVERARTRLLFTAVAVGALGGASEMINNLYPWFPELGSLGLLAACALIALVALRLRLFDDQVSLDAAAVAALIAAGAVAAQFLALRFLGTSSAALAAGTAAVALAIAAAARHLALAGEARRARVSQLVTLGRFSAQMAHDLKNPLAALQGAAQFLEVELAQPRPTAEPVRFVRLMLAQVKRLEQIVERYRRLSQVEPRRAPCSLNEIVRDVVALQSFAAGERIAVKVELAEGLVACDADRDLIASALENLLRNSIEALPGGGEVTVRTLASPTALLLSVEDDGPGMDARTRERAFDDFFTTKASGSGLGLAFVRRVAEAHGGSATLGARGGRGTVVTLRLPLSSAAAALEDEWPRPAQPS